MKQNIINARVTFRKSPIHVLEKFAFKDMPNACLTFKKNSSVSECVIIQTCNRIELFATSDNHNVDEIKNTWASLTGLEDNAFRDTLEVCENRDAYEHLLKLTSGLESLVVGEEQILGQIKESISAARKVDASGKRLNKLFERSIRIGTRIRNSTGIGRVEYPLVPWLSNLRRKILMTLNQNACCLSAQGKLQRWLPSP